MPCLGDIFINGTLMNVAKSYKVGFVFYARLQLFESGFGLNCYIFLLHLSND